MEEKKPVVFISYSHDSEEHSELVRGLGNSLIRDGCDVRLDVHKDTDEDWPTWMTQQLLEADFVFCVITETYENRFHDKELPDVGQGVGWEAGLIRRLLYAKKLHNASIFPISFESSDKPFIPIELQGYDFFNLDFHHDGQTNYENLLRKIHNQPRHIKPTPGSRPDLPAKPNNPLFARPDSAVPIESLSVTLSEEGGDSIVTDDAENRKARQKRQLSKMVAVIDKKKDALDVLSDSLRTFIVDEIQLDDAKSLVVAFNGLSDDDATNCVNSVFKKLCKERNINGAEDIGNFVEAWLPVVYEHQDKIPKIKSELSNPETATITVPTKLPITTEITMAEAEDGLVKLELSARNELVSRLNLGEFGELGLDEDGKEQQRQLYELLSRKFLKATDRSDFKRTVHGLVGAIGRKHDTSGELRTEDDQEILQKKLSGILRDLFELLDRRFYFCVEARDKSDMDVFKTLKAQYPTLAFLVSSCADEIGEANRYRKLSRIIATAKGDTTLCEEIAKHA